MNIPAVTKNLLIINILAFLAMLGLRGFGIDLNSICGLHFFLAPDFHFYQLVTYMFMHAGFQHILFNMFALWMFGCVVERVWGPKNFLFYYICAGIGAGLFQEAAQFVQFYVMAKEQISDFTFSQILLIAQNSSEALNMWTTVGASGAIYAVLLAFGMIFPEERIFMLPIPIPIKAKWFVLGYVLIELFSALFTSGGNVAHFAHLGGMLIGFLMIRYWQHYPLSSHYSRSAGEQWFTNLHSRWEQRSQRRSSKGNSKNSDSFPDDRQDDWNFNARKEAEQKEIDRILDKIRKSGYDSLTTEEKQKLFDQSSRK